MSTEPRTLRTLAALDKKASDLLWRAIPLGPEIGATPGTWEVWEDTATVAVVQNGLDGDDGKEAKASFIAASKGFAPALLRKLEALPTYDIVGEYDAVMMPNEDGEWIRLDELRALLDEPLEVTHEQ